MTSIILSVAGLGAGILLFFRFPFLPIRGASVSSLRISVIIPARNEEENIPQILGALKAQTIPVTEIICVDDGSRDHTAAIARELGVQVCTVVEKPEAWMGKSWACQLGANQAQGDLLLFLDADVKLEPQAVSKLLQAYTEQQSVISVQPFHKVLKAFENISFFFNLILLGANGVGLPFKAKHMGLFGPVILISKENYLAIDGHYEARNSIIEDLTLGESLRKKGIPFKLFVGGRDISFRMYHAGLKDLLQGWTKNFATASLKTPLYLMALVFLWVYSCTCVVIELIKGIVVLDPFFIAVYSFLYLAWVVELLWVSRSVGNFKKGYILCFPFLLAAFLGVFFYSLYRKMFVKNVVWKGRTIKLGR